MHLTPNSELCQILKSFNQQHNIFLICNSKTTPQPLWQHQQHLNNSTPSQSKNTGVPVYYSELAFHRGVCNCYEGCCKNFNVTIIQYTHVQEQAGQVDRLYHCYFSFYFLQMERHYRDNLTMIQIQNKGKSFERQYHVSVFNFTSRLNEKLHADLLKGT